MAETYQVRILGEGGRVAHTASADIAAGEVVITNLLFQFATQDILDTKLGTLRTAGGPPVVRAVKVTGAISVGNSVYWDEDGDPLNGVAGTGAATTTATANIFMGRCIAAAGGTENTVDVELTIGVVTGNNLQNEIGDPGDAAAIPVVATGHCPLVSGGAETRTIAAPSFVGQQLLVYLQSDGGDVTVTCTTTVNETGNDTILFDDEGESLLMTAVEEGATLRWRLATVDGATLSTA